MFKLNVNHKTCTMITSIKIILTTIFSALFVLFVFHTNAIEKPRIFVLTDIENEPDDAMSMVRFLVYANQYDIEGLAATTSIHQQKRVAPERIHQIAKA